MKILNLYAGLGGNRKEWGDKHEITAIEYDEKIAAVYKELYPNDTVIVADAHQYLQEHFNEFDFIWASPPCQTHSKMVKATRHKGRKYPDMKLYEEIIFLKNFFNGTFVVENVKPYYEPLIKPDNTIGRHLFWTNIDISSVQDIKRPGNFINKSNLAGMKELCEWLDIQLKRPIYYNKNHCPCQVLRNCVHPQIGKQILECVN